MDPVPAYLLMGRNYTKIHILSKNIADLFRVAVDSMEEERETETEYCSSKESREHSNLLPADLNPRIHKEAHREHNERYKAYTQWY